MLSGDARQRRWWHSGRKLEKRDKAKNCLQVGYPRQKYGEEYFTPPLNRSIPQNCKLKEEKNKTQKDEPQRQKATLHIVQ